MRAVQRHHPFLRTFLILALAAPAFILQTCRNLPNDPAPDDGEYEFMDLICTGPGSSFRSFEQTETGQDYLYEWSYRNGSLNLDFRFDCTCNAAYEDSLVRGDRILEIFLRDTASFHARCICPHRSLFKVPMEAMDSLRLIFSLFSLTEELYETRMDTVLTVAAGQVPSE